MDSTREDPVQAAAPTAPAWLGPHAVKDLLGRGGMGEVFLVADESLGREVAAKVLREGADARLQDAFVREARLTGQLDHPGIVPVHALRRATDGRLFFTMKRVDGETLSELAARDEASLVKRLEVFLKVCDAVAFAHDRGVIHRDLKPANVMVGRFGEVLVMDWGLGKRVGEAQDDLPPGSLPRAIDDGRPAMGPTELMELASRPGTVAGTPAYMAPEQARGEAGLDALTDVYGLGAILYELLAGRPPFEGATAEQVLAQVLRAELVPPSARAPGREVPWELEAIVRKAMARRREDRYQGALALREDVFLFLEGRLVGAARYGLLRRAAKWARRHRTALLLSAALAVTAALVAGLAWRARRDAQAFAADAAAATSAAAGGRHRDALVACERALSRREDPDLRALAAASAAALEREADEQVRARERAERYARLQEALRPVARKIDETRPFFHVKHVDIRRKLDEVEALLEPLDRLAREPGLEERAEPWALLGVGWALVGRPGRARAALERAHALDPDDPWTRFHLARLHLERGALAATRAGLVAEETTLAEQHMAAAARLLDHPSLARTGALEQALTAALRALATRQYALAARLALDGTERFKGELGVSELWIVAAVASPSGDAARTALETALRLQPHSPMALMCRAGLVLTDAHDARAALADMDAALRIHPASATLLYNRSAMRYALGDLPGALADCTAAIAEEPDLAVAWYNRGQAHFTMGRFEQAAADLRRAAELRTSDARARLALGDVELRLGRLDAAKAAYEQVVALGTDDALTSLALEGLAELAFGAAAPEEGLRLLRRAVALAPGRTSTRLRLSVLLAQTGDAAGAQAERAAALATTPEEPLDWVARSKAHHQDGRLDQALADVERALELHAGNLDALLHRARLRMVRAELAGARADLDAFLAKNQHPCSL